MTSFNLRGFPCGSDGKASACNAGDPGSIPGSGRSPGTGNGNPLQYSCLKITWTEEPGGLQSIGSQRVWLNWATSLHFTSLHFLSGSISKYSQCVGGLNIWILRGHSSVHKTHHSKNKYLFSGFFFFPWEEIHTSHSVNICMQKTITYWSSNPWF